MSVLTKLSENETKLVPREECVKFPVECQRANVHANLIIICVWN